MTQAAFFFPNIDPVLIHLGPLAIRWYALSYIAGLLLGWRYILNLLANHKLWAGKPFMGKAPATADQIGDLFVWITLGVILGGRLGYVLLYGTAYCGFAGHGAPACDGLPEAYLTNPLKIIAAWEGGMSFHGGLLGVVLAMFLYCRRYKLDFMRVADLVAAATPIGLFFGRIANFVNGELWGKVTTVPWGMVFCNRVIEAANGGECPAGLDPRHPSQLYEAAMEGLLLFLILRVAIYRFQIHRKPGLVIALFLAGYGLFRFIAEFFRDFESKIYGWFSMGQALSLPMWVAAAGFLLVRANTPQVRAVTALKERILKLIGVEGPISIAQYMQIALGDPQAGYYMRNNPIGQAGDFITAPEVSQIFGELLGLCLVQAWEDRGRPERFHLVELGPGRGTLMADIVRASRIRPAFRDAAQITLVETSPTLRREQARALTGMEARWATNLAEIADDAPLFLVANEFFDVLPIRQFVRGPRGWHERMVAAEGDRLIFAMTPDMVPVSAIPERLRDAPEGSIVEIDPAAQAVAREIGHRIAEHGGVALIIDYGYAEAATGETFQAVRKQFFADPLAEPGEADLTAHVDFGALADAAREAGAIACGPVPQGYLLEQLGIGARAEALKLADPYEAADIDSGVARLTKPRQMGALFKALAICDRAPPGVPGFPC